MNILIVFASRTNNIRRFISKLEYEKTLEIKENDFCWINEPFLLITYTDKLGQVPEIVENFLIKNNKFLKGVAASGNSNFGQNFAKSADIISEMYNVPIICKFELSGSPKDYNAFKTFLENINKNND